MRARVLAAARATVRKTERAGSRVPRRATAVLGAFALLGTPLAIAPANAQEDAGFGRVSAEPEDGGAFTIGQIVLEYAWNREGDPFAEHPSLPGVEALYSTRVRLLQTDAGFVRARSGLPTVSLTIGELNAMPEQVLYRSAVVAVMEAIRDRLNREGVIGVFAYPKDLILTGQGTDQRSEGDNGMMVRVLIGWVGETRTIGSGDRFGDDAVRNAAVHARIQRNSPVQAAGEGERNVLDRRALDEYVLRLNRHPGRVVNLGVGAGVDPGSVVVDYHVFEAKPWYAYFQLSNTGTEETSEWRERFGFVHNQLTNNDDVLTIDYVTAGFEDSHALVMSYEAPFGRSETLRWRVSTSYNEFTGSDIGGDRENDIDGDGWSLGGDMIWTVYQDREIFVDVVGGVRYQEVSFDAAGLGTSGDGSFLLPHVGVQVDRLTEISSFFANADLEIGFASEDQSELERLGRVGVDSEWAKLSYGFEWSFFLEPVFNREQFLDQDPTWNQRKTLAHEVAFELHGQEVFGATLVPSHQAVTGGAGTVRGYPESEVPSDSVIVATAEYRFHVPRAFEPGRETNFLGRSFKFRPSRTWGRPDWDLVAKAFLDVGRTTNSGSVSFEPDETLVGAGLGMELVFKRNFVLSVDWGVALEDTADVESGDSEVHFVLTLLY